MGIARLTIAAVLLGVAAACATDDGDPTGAPAATTVAPTTTSALREAGTTAPPMVRQSSPDRIATTSSDGSGNRVVAGRIDLAAEPLSVELDSVPEWVVGAATDDGVVWVVVDGEGRARAVLETEGALRTYPIEMSALPPGMPPTLLATATSVQLFDPIELVADVAPLAGHIIVGGVPVIIDGAGGVHVGDTLVSAVTALPDSRIVAAASGLVALMSDPTERLTHAVIGDRVEAETVTVIDPGTATVSAVLDAPDGTVFEAISPMWADVDRDGTDEIVVTASDSSSGARLTVFAASGELLAQSPPIGSGNRWLNQLAVAATGPSGETEVIEVKTPHIGGIVQWYQLDGDRLELQAGIPGYSTHGIFSRNLDEGLVIDVGGDGRLDVVVPSQDDRTLAVLTRVTGGAEVTLEVDLSGLLGTNLAGVVRGDGSATVAAATADGLLLVWP